MIITSILMSLRKWRTARAHIETLDIAQYHLLRATPSTTTGVKNEKVCERCELPHPTPLIFHTTTCPEC